MEISQVSIEKSNSETKTKLGNDIMRLLQVRDKNKQMLKDWLLFICTSKFNSLRAGEIYEAFKMAMSRELLNEKNEEINLLPELSNNTTGIVLTSYLRWKKTNDRYHYAKDKLKRDLNHVEITQEEKDIIREEFLNMVFNEIKEIKKSDSAWLLWEDVKLKINKRPEVLQRLFEIQKTKFIVSKPIGYEFLKGSKASVQQICRNITVVNYLKKYVSSFEDFKKAIQ